MSSIFDLFSDANALAIDGIFVGKNWTFNDEEQAFDASYVDDDTLDKHEWFLSSEELETAVEQPDGSWRVTCDNDEVVEIIGYKLTQI